LEYRTFLAGTAVLSPDGTLTVNGTDGNDEIALVYHSNDVIINGTYFDFSNLPSGTIKQTFVNSLGGDDHVIAQEDFADRNPLVIDLGDGDNTATLVDMRAGVIGGAGRNTVEIFGEMDVDFLRGVETLDITEQFNQFQTLDMNQFPTVSRLIGAQYNVICNNEGDYIELEYTGDGHTVLGGTGNDKVVSAADSDSFTGGPGDDVFVETGNIFGYPPDNFIGGSGLDTIDFTRMGSALIVGLPAGEASIRGGNLLVLLGGIENAIGGSGDDLLIGDNHRNILDGGPGNDTLIGNGAKDLFIGGPGNDLFVVRDKKRDTVIGGDGDDTAIADKQDKLIEVETIDVPTNGNNKH
jgi:Ca2+-binding RTX toxin-like protein